MRNSNPALRLLAALVVACALAGMTAMAVPMVLRYDARLQSNGALFTGTGQFKFALINPAGTTTHWSQDGSSTAGSEPTAFLSRSVVAGNASVVLGEPPMQAIPPAVFSDQASLRLRVWFNDGTHGFQRLVPDQPISPVPSAIVTAQADSVADGGVTTSSLTAGAVTTAKISNDAVTASAFAPDSVTAAKLAPNAATVAVASLDLGWLTTGSGLFSATADDPALLANGYVSAGTFQRPESWEPKTTDFYRRNGHYTAWTGSELIVWGGIGSNHEYQLSGIGWIYTPATNVWRKMSGLAAPVNRSSAVSVFTGGKFIIWGGNSVDVNEPFVYYNDGAVYDVATDSWAAMPTSGAPTARFDAGAVWTGTQMIIFGGRQSTISYQDGGIFDLATNAWLPLTTTNAPWARYSFKPVWSGTEMYVFGGKIGSTASGARMARFNPATNVWTSLPDVPAPDTSQDHGTVGVWTGSELLIWGARLIGPAPVHHRYSPATNAWTLMATTNEPGRSHTNTDAVWTGTEMVVIGSKDSTTNVVSLGTGRYNPATNTWSFVSTVGAPSPRVASAPVWTGTEMMILGGTDADLSYFADAYGYAPGTDSWRNIETPANIADGRQDSATAWTGSDFYMWGGLSVANILSDGARYNAAEGRWYSLAAPFAMARYSHSMVWTGSQLLIFGGKGVSTLNDLITYTPATGLWETVTLALGSPIPTARTDQGAVWTGTEMIIFGGRNSGGTALGDGWRYNPATRTWTALPAGNAPSARFDMHAFWTGQKAIFWGGTAGAPVGGGAMFDPAFNVWTNIPDVIVGAGAGAQEWRSGAVWTGTEMIVWGGQNGTSGVNTGARFNPAAATWTNMSTLSAPSARLGHVALWDGSRMIVLCGRSEETASRVDYRNGGIYTPATDSWTPIANGPVEVKGRVYASGAWAGGAAVVINGFFGSDPVQDWFLFRPSALSYVFLKP